MQGDYKSYTINYLEGKISPGEFEAKIEADDGLYQWIQSIVPDGKTYSYCEAPLYKLIYYPYDIRVVMKIHEALDYGGPKGSLGYHYYIHKEVAQLVQNAFPDCAINLDSRPQVLHKLEIMACPRYIGGNEVVANNILSKLLSDIPLEWSQSKQTKVAKERIKAAFHIEGNNYPHWIQEPEWPVHDGKPMKYIKTVRVNSEFVQHHFIDVETGNVRVIDDFH